MQEIQQIDSEQMGVYLDTYQNAIYDSLGVVESRSESDLPEEPIREVTVKDKRWIITEAGVDAPEGSLFATSTVTKINVFSKYHTIYWDTIPTPREILLADVLSLSTEFSEAVPAHPQQVWGEIINAITPKEARTSERVNPLHNLWVPVDQIDEIVSFPPYRAEYLTAGLYVTDYDNDYSTVTHPYLLEREHHPRRNVEYTVSFPDVGNFIVDCLVKDNQFDPSEYRLHGSTDLEYANVTATVDSLFTISMEANPDVGVTPPESKTAIHSADIIPIAIPEIPHPKSVIDLPETMWESNPPEYDNTTLLAHF